jgi:hypothetical protein
MEESKRISIERKLTESGAFSDLNNEEVYVMDGDGSDCFQICLEKGYLKTKQFKKLQETFVITSLYATEGGRLILMCDYSCIV